MSIAEVSIRYLIAKRLFDLAVCVLLLPVVLPLLLLCALAIRLDSPGPIFIAQERTGRDGTPFRMLKFRTMVRNAAELKAQLAHLNVLPPPDFKIPQLLNVLWGDMSLVGPRPTSFAPSTYQLWHTHRLEVTPGITGLWQVKGRNTTTFDERLRLDIEYIEHRSFGFDLKILLQTVPSVLRRTGE